MTADEDGAALAPDAAFELLGNETRVEILRALGEAAEPQSFSALRRRVGTRDSGQFNYHLDKLLGTFVAQTDAGYELLRAGERVVEAVLSGAITEAPVLEPTQIDQACPFCDAPILVSYRDEQVRLFCTECDGAYGRAVGDGERGYLGALFLPPAGVQGRSPAAVYRAANAWGGLATMTAANGVCPRCSATLDETLEICESHDDGDGVCEGCHGRYAIHVRFRCQNCIYDRAGAFGVKFISNTDLLAFLTARGVNPVPPSQLAVGATLGYDETLVSTDPFEARFTYAVDGDALTLTVGADLSVVDVERRPARE